MVSWQGLGAFRLHVGVYILLILLVIFEGSNAFAPTKSQIRTTTCRVSQLQKNPLSFYPARISVSHTRLTTKETNEESKPPGPLRRAVDKFKARPGTYMLIPCVAALVGWFTNYLAVQMIFYPIKFRGIPIIIKEEVPLGLLSWQGIVPCKTRPMSEAMVNMVTSQLLSVQEAFHRLDPRRVAHLLAPEVPKLGQEIVSDVLPPSLPSWLAGVPKAVFLGLPSDTKSIIEHWNFRFLHDFTVAMQENIGSLLNLRNCVVDQMLQDRTLLGQLFRKCGQKELDFLTNSGLWFGFLLGLIQMVVALFWDNPWSLSIGGGIVGLATNWLALKWIFEPVNPTKIGPFVLQGQFLRRQKEVSREFSKFFAKNVLTSEKVWNSILTDPETTPAFHKLFTEHFTKFVNKVTKGLRIAPEPEVIGLAASKAISKLPDHIGVLHSYVDKTLGLEDTLRERMEKMTSSQFERVLHPIFEEDELTLILAGAALGFAAGLVQQGLETGKIKLPDFKVIWKALREHLRTPRKSAKLAVTATRSQLSTLVQRIKTLGRKKPGAVVNGELDVDNKSKPNSERSEEQPEVPDPSKEEWSE